MLILLLSLICQSVAFTTLNESLPPLININNNALIKKIDVFTNQRFISQFAKSAIPSELKPFCHLHDSHLSIQTIFQLGDTDTDGAQHNPIPTFEYSKGNGIIYKLTQQQITAYRMNQTTISKENTLQFKEKCRKSMILHGEYLYIFSCDGIYSVEVKHTLINMTKIDSGSYAVQGVISVDDLLLSIDAGSVKVYGVQMDNKLTQINHISSYQNVPLLNITNIYYRQNKLYILDRANGIYIFNRTAPNAFTPENNIKLSPTHTHNITYQHLQTENNSFYVGGSYRVGNKQQAFVCQFQLQNTIFYLVRYYKGYGYINKVQIIHNKLLILSDKGVDVYDVNQDPRILSSTSAPYSNSHEGDIISMHKISCDKHIIITQKIISVVRISIVEQKIQCNFNEPNTYAFTHQIGCNKIYGSYKNRAIIDNVLKETKFNVNCSQVETVILNVTEQHRDPLIWMVLLTVGLSIVVVLLLMFWREAKVQVIDKLALEIIRLREKEHSHAQEVQFVEHPATASNAQDKWKAFHDQIQSNEDNNAHKQQQIVSQRTHLQQK